MSQVNLGIGGHNRTDCKEDWLTPPEILAALGRFDLDPCSPLPRPWDTAVRHYTVADNGLAQPWKAPHNGGAPSVLIAYGQNNAETLRTCGIEGRLVELDNRKVA